AVAKESDSYGAMDGATKFGRGAAIADTHILLINLLGDFAIGMLVHDLSAADSWRLFALLSIGDGLAAQIPALLLSTVAAIIITRTSESAEIIGLVRKQMLAQPAVLYTVAGVISI